MNQRKNLHIKKKGEVEPTSIYTFFHSTPSTTSVGLDMCDYLSNSLFSRTFRFIKEPDYLYRYTYSMCVNIWFFAYQSPISLKKGNIEHLDLLEVIRLLRQVSFNGLTFTDPILWLLFPLTVFMRN